MKRALLVLVLLAWAATAAAVESWRVGNRIVAVGDTMVQVLQVAGEPRMKNRIENDLGGTVGNRWYYVKEGYNAKTVAITFRGGRVVSIEMEKN